MGNAIFQRPTPAVARSLNIFEFIRVLSSFVFYSAAVLIFSLVAFTCPRSTYQSIHSLIPNKKLKKVGQRIFTSVLKCHWINDAQNLRPHGMLAGISQTNFFFLIFVLNDFISR